MESTINESQEVSAEAMRSELCMNYKAKDYLLHSQNAIMEMVYRNSTQPILFTGWVLFLYIIMIIYNIQKTLIMKVLNS